MIFALIGWALWPGTVASILTGEFIGTRGIFTAPVWPLKVITLVGVIMTAVEFGIQAGTALRVSSAVKSGQLTLMIASVVILIATCVLLWVDPSRLVLGILCIGVLTMLIFSGMHIAVAMLMVGFVGIWLMRDNVSIGISALRSATTGTIDKFDFGVVPLFVLMGLLVNASGLGKDSYAVAASLLRKLAGGLAIATVAANAVFAAITGISIASAAVFTRVAVPQMRAHSYSGGFAAGTVAGSSVLGMMIPPSLLLIIYGFVTETSVGKLFVAATVPGILLAISFCIYIYIAARYFPAQLGCPTVADDVTPIKGSTAVRALLPILSLVVIVLGGIYTGVFSPTQAGAVGAFVALVIAALRRSLTAAILWSVMKETGIISVVILLLIVAAAAFTKMLVISGIPAAVLGVLTDSEMSFWGFMLCYFAIIVVLGMFLDSTSIILIVVPLVAGAVPIIAASAVSGEVMVWFGIVTVLAVEIGLLTPPFGLSVYVVKATLDDPSVSLGDVFRGALPYVCIMAAVTLVLTAFPILSLFWI